MRLRLGVAAGLAAVLAAGCGGGGGGSKAPAGAASIVPEGVAAYVAADTDLDSASWQKAQALLDKFPGKEDILTSLRQSLEKQGLSWEQDVQPALGNEIDFVWLDLRNNGDDLVGVTKPNDVNKFNAMLEQGSSPSVHEQIEGWTVFANGQAQLDAFEQARRSGGSLDGDPVFNDAMDGLPPDSIVKAFVRGSDVQNRIDQAIAKGGGPPGTTANQVGTLDSIGMALTPESNGIRIVSAFDGDLKLGGGGYHAELPASVPAGAMLYLSFNDVGGRFDKLLESYGSYNENFDQQRTQIETALGMSLDDVLRLLGGEGAFVLYPTSSGAPSVLFALRVDDEARAQKLIDKTAALAQLGGSAQVSRIQVGSVSATELTLSNGTTVDAAAFGGKLVITNSRTAIEGMQAGTTKLASDPVYTAASGGAAMPSETGGFMYFNLRTGLDWSFSYAESRGSNVPQIAKDNLSPLRGLLLYSAKEGGSFRFTGFLGIE